MFNIMIIDDNEQLQNELGNMLFNNGYLVTKIKELDKVFTAEDCGGGIKGNKVDIYMNSQSACRNWGVKTITLQILK